jgi:outer membrane lipoprotein-sorting protein
MSATKRTLILLAGVGLLATGAVAQSDNPRAKQLLSKVLNRKSDHNVQAYVWQLLPDGSGGAQQFQVSISKSGKMWQRIIFPGSMEGITAVDDLVRMSTLFPNQQRVVIQSSPRSMECDAEFRLGLAERNYRLRMEPRTAMVAGQRAAVVVAIPENAELETRRFYIDDRTGYLLKLETTIGNETTLRLETKQISYPASIPDSKFVLDVPPGTSKSVYGPPEQIDGPINASKVGFMPVLAKKGANLPLGFCVQDVQVSQNQKYKSVAVRITDGLVRGTVYQMPAKGKIGDLKNMSGIAVRDAGAIRIIVAADVPAKVRESILREFLSRIQSNVEPMAWGRLTLANVPVELEYVPVALLESRGQTAGQLFRDVVPPAQDALRPTTVSRGGPIVIVATATTSSGN